jgi:hypothetical protein
MVANAVLSMNFMAVLYHIRMSFATGPLGYLTAPMSICPVKCESIRMLPLAVVVPADEAVR